MQQRQPFLDHLTELKIHLLNRKYPNTVIESAFDKVKQITRCSTLLPKKRTHNTRVPPVVTYNHQLPPLNKIVHQHLPVLHASERCKNAIPEAPLISFRRPPNLRDKLVFAELKPLTCQDEDTPTPPPGVQLCNKKCDACTYIRPTTIIQSTATGKSYPIKHHITCNSINLIYVIQCRLWPTICRPNTSLQKKNC